MCLCACVPSHFLKTICFLTTTVREEISWNLLQNYLACVSVCTWENILLDWHCKQFYADLRFAMTIGVLYLPSNKVFNPSNMNKLSHTIYWKSLFSILGMSGYMM